MEKVKYSGWNEHNDEVAVEIKAGDDMSKEQSGGMSDSFDRVYSFRYSIYHLYLRFAKIEDFLIKFRASC